jgi:signal transduction histidine kinase/CheY-like chemotaxis protein
MSLSNKNLNADNVADGASAFVENHFVDIFLKQNTRSQIGLFFCILCIYGILINKVGIVFVNTWIAFALVVNFIRFQFTQKLVQSASNKFRMIGFLLILNALVMVSPLFKFALLSDLGKAVLTILITTIAASAVATTNGHKKLFAWFVVPMIVPLVFVWGMNSIKPNNATAESVEISILLIVYLVFLYGLARNLYSLFNESCRIRFSEYENNQKLKFALEESKSASLAKTRFLASASHDLRQPMHTIGVLLAALRMRTLDERSREIVEVLGTVNTSLSSQLDGLLDISKLDAGVVTPDLQVYKLGDLVRAHVAKITLSDEKEKLYVHVHATADVLVKTDIVLFERILMNLTGNAIKFTEQGGIDITISATDEKVILEVADTGIGIANNFHSLVFQEFYQVGNAERDRTAGLGLGLSIVKRICSLLRIHIHLTSALGQGSRFVMTMPLVRNTDYVAMKKVSQEAVHLPEMTALVIDDEVDIRTGMRLLLEELGCKVILADGINQAVAAAKAHKFDVVFSDYRLRGDENGIDAIGHVRVVQPGVDAVLITGDTAPERLRSAQQANIQMLHKPVSFEAILKQLRHTARFI